MVLNRRKMLKAASGLPLLVALGCTINSKDGKITATLDVNTLVNYGEAGLKAADTVASYLSVLPLLSPYTVALTTASKALDAGLKALLAATGGRAQIDYNETSWRTKVDSIFSSLSKMNDIVAGIAASQDIISDEIKKKIALISQAFDTLIDIIKALLNIPVASRYGAKKMSERQALQILTS